MVLGGQKVNSYPFDALENRWKALENYELQRTSKQPEN